MNTIEITTAQKVTIQYELATVGNRFTSFFLDMMVLIGLIICFNIVFLEIIGFEDYQYFLYLVILPLVLFYTLISEILMDGETIGKRATGLKVIKLNGDPASAYDYVIRWAFRWLDIWMSAGSVAALLISATPTSQRLGCMLSGTTVIRQSSSRNFTLLDIMKISTKENYAATYPMVTQFSDEEMLFVKKVLDRAKKYKNEAHKEAVFSLAKRMAEQLNIPSNAVPVNKGSFLKTLLTDYIILTR